MSPPGDVTVAYSPDIVSAIMSEVRGSLRSSVPPTLVNNGAAYAFVMLDDISERVKKWHDAYRHIAGEFLF